MSESPTDDSPITLHPVYLDYADKDLEWVFEYLRRNRELARRLRISSVDMFPVKLHELLEICTASPTLSVIIRWLPHGRAFKLYDKKRFINKVLPKFFQGHSAYSSFQRQLNMYCYLKLTGDHDDNGAYYHPLMLRGRPVLSKLHLRQRDTEKNHVRRRLDPRSEPNFYGMMPLSDQTTLSNAGDVASISSCLGDENEGTVLQPSGSGSSDGYTHGYTNAIHDHNPGSASAWSLGGIYQNGVASPQAFYWPTNQFNGNSEYLYESLGTGLPMRNLDVLERSFTPSGAAPASNVAYGGVDSTLFRVGVKRRAMTQSSPECHRINGNLNDLTHNTNESLYLDDNKWTASADNPSIRTMSSREQLSSTEESRVDLHFNIAPASMEREEFPKRPRHDSNPVSVGAAPIDKGTTSCLCFGERFFSTETSADCGFEECDQPFWIGDDVSYVGGDLSYDCGSEMTEMGEMAESDCDQTTQQKGCNPY